MPSIETSSTRVSSTTGSSGAGWVSLVVAIGCSCRPGGCNVQKPGGASGRIEVVEPVVGEHGAAGRGDRAVHRVVGVALPGVPRVVGRFGAIGEALRSLA